MSPPSVLVIEYNDSVRAQCHEILRFAGFNVQSVGAPADLTAGAVPRWVDVLIAGSGCDRPQGLARFMRHVRKDYPGLPVVFTPASASVDTLVDALRAEVNDCVPPPVTGDDLVGAVQRCLRRARATDPTENEPLDMIGESEAMRAVKHAIERSALADSNVLITGESGTGKELAARMIHARSPRSGKPFIVINCAAVPDSLVESELFGHEKGSFTGADAQQIGKLQMANGGTVLFDEIGDMSPFAQTKILRAVETKEIQRLGTTVPSRLNIRILAATNQNLEKLSAEGKFRRDLYYRLNVMRIHMPALKDRPGDIPLLIEHGCLAWSRRAGRNLGGFSPDAADALARYSWPGNVRELNNFIEASFAVCDSERLSLNPFPMPCRLAEMAADVPPMAERERLMSALLSCDWNKSKAAQQLQWSRMTLYRKVAKYQLAKRAG
jgi:DNA-binding NtrC family response regulator